MTSNRVMTNMQDFSQANPEDDDVYTAYVDQPDSDEDYPGGENNSPIDAAHENARVLMSHGDEAPRAEVMSLVARAVIDEIARERKEYETLKKSGVRVLPNLSGEVQFQRYSVAQSAVQICREKPLRGRVVLTNYSAASIWISTQPGLIANGSDCIRLVGANGGVSREIKTKRALWAIAGGTDVIELDVQEEFD